MPIYTVTASETVFYEEIEIEAKTEKEAKQRYQEIYNERVDGLDIVDGANFEIEIIDEEKA